MESSGSRERFYEFYGSAPRASAGYFTWLHLLWSTNVRCDVESLVDCFAVITFNFSDFMAKAKELDAAADQVPFALSRALNQAVQNTRRVLTEVTWPSAMEIHNKGFIRRALRTKFSTKGDLRVSIFDDLHRANLAGHAYGDTKTPRGGHLAIPPKGLFARGASGIARGSRPRALIASTPKRALRITPKGIFIGAGGSLHLQYAFASSAQQPADVRFEDDFKTSMLNDVRTSFPAAMANAMATRR